MANMYLIIDLAAVFIPFVFSFHPKLQFYKNWKAFLLASLVTIVPFILWDVYFTKIEVWGFNPNYLTGIKVWNLPLEEVLFFICIPYACVFTYHCLDKIYKLKLKDSLISAITIGLIVIAIVGSVIFFEQLYTRYTLLSLFVFLSFLYIKKEIRWLGKFYIVFALLLLPFLIVNGILTGSFLAEPIVWYNNEENLGCRIFTIPVEDFFYAIVLLAPIIYLYDLFRRKSISE